MICHYCCFLNCNFKYKPQVCDNCHNMSLMAYELEIIAILNAKDIDSTCVIWNMSRNNAIDRSNNSELDDRGSL